MNRVRILCFVMFVFCVTPAMAAMFSVEGMIESKTGGFKFPDGSFQSTAAVSSPVDPQPVSIGKLTLDSITDLAVYDLEFDVVNQSNLVTGGPALPVLSSVSVTVEAGNDSVNLWQLLASGMQINLVTLVHDDVVFRFENVRLESHEQIAPQNNGANTTLFTRISFNAEIFQMNVMGTVVGWNFAEGFEEGQDCNQDDRTYFVANGPGVPTLPTITVPAESYAVGIKKNGGVGGTTFDPLKLELVDQHAEAACLLQYALVANGLNSTIVVGNVADSSGRFSDSYELDRILVSSWNVSVSDASKLEYVSTIKAARMCHRVTDRNNMLETCWDSLTNSPF